MSHRPRSKRRTDGFVGHSSPQHLLEALVRQGCLEPDDRDALSEAARTTGQSLCTLLLALRSVDESVLAQTLVHVCDLPYLDLRGYTVDPDILALVTAEMRWQRQVLPLDRVGKTLTLAMTDPLDNLTAMRIGAECGLAVTRVVALSTEMKETLRRHAPAFVPPPESFDRPEAQQAIEAAGAALVRMNAPPAAPTGAPLALGDDSGEFDMGWLGELGGGTSSAISSAGTVSEEDLEVPGWLEEMSAGTGPSQAGAEPGRKKKRAASHKKKKKKGRKP